MTNWETEMEKKGFTAKNCRECIHDKTCKSYFGSNICRPEKADRTEEEEHE